MYISFTSTFCQLVTSVSPTAINEFLGVLSITRGVKTPSYRTTTLDPLQLAVSGRQSGKTEFAYNGPKALF